MYIQYTHTHTHNVEYSINYGSIVYSLHSESIYIYIYNMYNIYMYTRWSQSTRFYITFFITEYILHDARLSTSGAKLNPGTATLPGPAPQRPQTEPASTRIRHGWVSSLAH